MKTSTPLAGIQEKLRYSSHSPENAKSAANGRGFATRKEERKK
jgi:hypothetical protein